MGDVNRKDLQSLARTRLAEAKTLSGAGRPDGAYYPAGYSIECALKACIAKGTQRHEFPDKKSVDASYTHNLRDLIKVAIWNCALGGGEERLGFSQQLGRCAAVVGA
jgi:hypothetical protein